MPNYEIVYILNQNINDDLLPNAINKVNELITKTGAEITNISQWGRKKFSYPIKKQVEGHYVLANFKAEPTTIKKIDASLKLNDDVLRHLIVKLDK